MTRMKCFIAKIHVTRILTDCDRIRIDLYMIDSTTLRYVFHKIFLLCFLLILHIFPQATLMLRETIQKIWYCVTVAWVFCIVDWKQHVIASRALYGFSDQRLCCFCFVTQFVKILLFGIVSVCVACFVRYLAFYVKVWLKRFMIMLFGEFCTENKNAAKCCIVRVGAVNRCLSSLWCTVCI